MSRRYGVKYTARNGERVVERAVHLTLDEHIEIALGLQTLDDCEDFFGDPEIFDDKDPEWQRLVRWAWPLYDLYQLGLHIKVVEY